MMQGVSASSGAAVEVHRESHPRADRLRAYRVIIDGVVAGNLRAGALLRCDVSPGRHIVWVAIDWARSEQTQVELAADETARFECRGARSAFDAARRSFRPESYLTLERQSVA
jgi:hypothetical protein